MVSRITHIDWLNLFALQRVLRQHTLLNLCSNFTCPRESWPDLARRIGEIISGQKQLFPPASDFEVAAQRYTALIIQSKNRADGIDGNTLSSDYRNVDISTLEFIRPRSIGIEHVAYEALRQLQLGKKLQELGLNKHYHYIVVSKKRHREFSEKAHVQNQGSRLFMMH